MENTQTAQHILVTGAGGYVGRHVVAQGALRHGLLDQDCEPFVDGSPPLERGLLDPAVAADP